MEVAGGCYNSGVVGSGAGGSSFISGYTGCNAIEETSTLENIVHTGNSMHYSGLSFIDSQMINGNTSMPSQDGSTTMIGNSEDGYAKISFISDLSSDSSLKSLKIDKGTMVEEFSPELHEYTVKLNEDEYIVNFELETNDPLASVEKSEYVNVSVPAGNSRHKINVYAQDGTRTQYIINFERTANSYEYINGVTINGKYYKFIDGIYNYKIILPYDEDDLIDITTDYLRPSQNIQGLGTFVLKHNNYQATIKVTSEDKTKTTIYNLNIVKENSNKLKSLEVSGFNIGENFDPDIREYDLIIAPGINNLDIFATPYDSSSVVKIEGNTNIPEENGKVTITVSNTQIAEDIIYTINISKNVGTLKEYSATGDYEEFIAPVNGKYKIELWGASGSRGSTQTGYGAYTSGEIELKRGENLYLYVGKSGDKGGYNGGGGNYNSKGTASYSGGGATDVRLTSGTWNDITSLRSRIMVAAGGGGHYGYNPATYSGSGGGLTGYGGTAHPIVGYRGNGASQTAGGSGSKQNGGFGYGGGNGAYSDGHIGGGRRRRLLWWWWNYLAFTRWPEVHHSYQVMMDVMQLQKKENTQDKAYIIQINILQTHL